VNTFKVDVEHVVDDEVVEETFDAQQLVLHGPEGFAVHVTWNEEKQSFHIEAVTPLQPELKILE
jgi:hypothetical protein